MQRSRRSIARFRFPGITTLSQMVGDSIAEPKFFATLAVMFAGMAALLAAVDIYGVMAYSVSQQTTD